MKYIALALGCLLYFATAIAQLPDHVQVFEPVPALVSGVSHDAAPSDAIVLFDGSNMNAWERLADGSAVQWDIEDDGITVNGTGTIRSKQAFRDFQLHIEWKSTDVIEGQSQSRGNSGIFLHSLYEIQILDGWENPTYVNGQAGAVYLQHIPEVNATRRPGEWQSYDIIFTAPVYLSSGALGSPAYVTVLHNGVLVQNHVEILGSTFTRAPEYTSRCTPYSHEEVQACDGRMPLLLQDHGQVVSFRNIWLREL
ncbi:MAG: DUF1080 domain-containing protein [Gammaproteobacteria bacterium]|jgi:hypothetical protein|nr:DUF1080 domain-containing protein [Gammaproteobacteria bacterium]